MFHKKKNIFFNKESIISHLKDIYDLFRGNKSEEESSQKKWQYWFIIWDCIMLFLVYVFLFSGLKMEWLLKDIIPIGGDIPYHFANYIDLKEIFLPNWEIAGWSDASYAGYSIFQSYPFFSFILVYILDIFIGSWVAFKIVLILGALGLPLAMYWTLLQTKVPRPGPIFGAILSLAYLFHESHYAFGGNLRSIFSWEFVHSLSILFFVIFCGFLFKAFENKKYSIHASILLAIVGLTHPVSFVVAFFLPLFFLFNTKNEENGKWWFFAQSSIAVKIMLIGGLLFCTWAIGYISVSHYGGVQISDVLTKSYGWEGLTRNHLIPTLLLPFAILFVITVVASIFYSSKLTRAQTFFLWWFLISTLFFLWKFMWFGIRFLPLSYIFAILFIAATLGSWCRSTWKVPLKIFLYWIVIISWLWIYAYVQANNLFHKYQWTSWVVFSGMSTKNTMWNTTMMISDFLSKNYDTQTEKDRTTSYPPRVFSTSQWDILRITSRATIYDSIFSESSFGFQGKWVTQQINNKKISPEKIWNYLELSNIWVIIATKDLAKYLSTSTYFSHVETFGGFEIIQTNTIKNAYVVPLKTPVYAVSDYKKWVQLSLKWYRDYTAWTSHFLVHEPDMTISPFIEYTPKKISTVSPKNCTVQEFVERKKIRIQTDCIGEPLLIKFAYHPNWQVTGAKKIYLATPSFMIIVPDQNDVTLFYVKRPYNYLAYACGILGILLLFSYWVVEKYITWVAKKISKKYKKVFHMMDTLAQKIQLKKIWIFVWHYSRSLLCIVVLMVAIALFFSNVR